MGGEVWFLHVGSICGVSRGVGLESGFPMVSTCVVCVCVRDGVKDRVGCWRLVALQ